MSPHQSEAAIAEMFGRRRALIGMVHVGALPGTPGSRLSVREIAAAAVAEARILAAAGFDALLVENMHDVPYLRRRVGPEIVAAMTVIAGAVRDAAVLPVGVQILAGANHEALAAAHAIGATFVRVEGFVFASVADEGLLEEADAGPLLRYRRAIGAEGLRIFADIKKKHAAHAVTADVDLAQTARAATFFGADGVVVSGIATGSPTSLADLASVRQATELPVLVGSGARPEFLPSLFDHADAVIAGSWLKRDGDWRNPVDPARAAEIVRARG